MASFMMAMTVNPSAKKLHPDLSHQINESIEVFAKNKVKMTKLYATLGRYDYVALFDADDQGKAFKVAAEINAIGILETETWPIVPYEEFSQLM